MAQASKQSRKRGSDEAEEGYPAAPWPFLEAMADAAVVVDGDGRVVYANDRMQQLSGYAPSDLLGRAVEVLIPADAHSVHRARRRLYVTDGLVRRDMGTGIATRLLRRDGTQVAVDIALTPLFTDTGRLVLAAVRDMSDRQALVAALEDSEQWVRSQNDILEHVARDASLELTLRTLAEAVAARTPGAGCTVHIVDENSGMLRLRAAHGLDDAYAAQLADAPLTHALAVALEVPDLRRDPAWRMLSAISASSGIRAYSGTPVLQHGSAKVMGIVGLHRRRTGESSPRQAADLQSAARLVAIAIDHDVARSALSFAATHDTLSGLPNRFLLLDRLERVLAQRRRESAGHVGVVFLDLDQFKVVNDSLGHATGDRLLVAVGRRLADSVRPSDTLARFGGDEFVVLCERVADELHVLRIAQRLLDSLGAPLLVDSHRIAISASAGVSLDTGHGPDQGDSMIREADSAMYRAKERGGGRVEMFDPAMWEHAIQRLGLEADLRHAIEAGELRLAYQAEVMLETGAIVGAEALVRWQHPVRGLLLPDAFIPLAEQTGLIIPLGAWVLDRACADARRWGDHGSAELTVAVNVSKRQLVEAGFAESVRRTLEAHGVDPSMLCLEVTESAAFDATGQPAETLAELRAIGVHVALDDFGTGYASLATLRSIPADSMKIDRSFVAGVHHQRVERVLASACISMALRLGIDVVAEGIETDAQARMLFALGCPRGQGHLYALPIDSDAFTKLLGHRLPTPIVRARRD